MFDDKRCLTQSTKQGAHGLQQGLRPWLEENNSNFLHSFTATQVSLLSGASGYVWHTDPSQGKK